MPWCHLLLSMPIVGLAAFMFLPLPVAVPTYTVAAVASLLMYGKILKALRLPVVTGYTGMIGRRALVYSRAGDTGVVRCRGEFWSARFDSEVQPGEYVRVKDVRGLEIIASKSPTTGEDDARD